MIPPADTQTPAEALERLQQGLAALEDAVRHGDLHGLAGIEAELEAAAAQLAADPAYLSPSERAALGRLRATVARLTPMLAAAHQGVAAARARLHDVARAREGLGTYDRSGMRQVLTASGATRRPAMQLGTEASGADPTALHGVAEQDLSQRHATAPTSPTFRLKPTAE